MRSQSQPMKSRATMVTATDAMTVLPTCVFVRPRSSRTMAIIGAMPNHPKKARKKASQLMWKARMCGRAALKRSMLAALCVWGSILMLVLSSSFSSSHAARRTSDVG